jgi:hypothetical protein
MKSASKFSGWFFILALSAAGQNSISGTWKAEDVAFAPWTFTLKADGAKVTGTVSQGGSSGTITTTLTGATAIYDAALEGDNVCFKCDSPDDTKEMPAYVVSIAKGGHKLKEPEGPGPMELKPNGGAAFSGVTVAQLTERMSSLLQGVVVDETSGGE